MKKISIILVVAMIIVAIVIVNYSSYTAEKNKVKSYNAEFEQYKGKELFGLELATIINKAVDRNIKNDVQKDEKGKFIPNDSNSIEIEIYIQDNETTYKMESFYNAGTENFIEYYGRVKFKCSNIEYHKKTGRIKHVLFEQL